MVHADALSLAEPGAAATTAAALGGGSDSSAPGLVLLHVRWTAEARDRFRQTLRISSGDTKSSIAQYLDALPQIGAVVVTSRTAGLAREGAVAVAAFL